MKQVTKNDVLKVAEQIFTGFSIYDLTRALRLDGFYANHQDVKTFAEQLIQEGCLSERPSHTHYRIFEYSTPQDSAADDDAGKCCVDFSHTVTGVAPLNLSKYLDPQPTFYTLPSVSNRQRTCNPVRYSIYYNGNLFVSRNGKAAWRRKSDAVNRFGAEYFEGREYRDKNQRRAEYRQLKRNGILEIKQTEFLF